MDPCGLVLWTVGHSNHPFEKFLALVAEHQIECFVDVRSYPYSKFAPQFNRDELVEGLPPWRIRYLFLGDDLGGRPASEAHYDYEGHALYGPMAAEPGFRRAIERLLHGAKTLRLALLCSEGQPRDCHRRLLVGKVLADHGVELRHILPNGSLDVETVVGVGESSEQPALFGDDPPTWRSTQSASHRRRLSTSSAA